MRMVGTQITAQTAIYFLAIKASNHGELGRVATVDIVEIPSVHVIFEIIHDVAHYAHVRSKGDQFADALRREASKYERC